VSNPIIVTLWLFNIAMENGPFIDGLPIKNGGSFHGYVSHNQMVLQLLKPKKYKTIFFMWDNHHLPSGKLA
jgi:hypothetical protein